MEPFPKAEEMVFPSVRDSDPLPVGMKNGPAAHLYREIRFIANKIRKKDIALKYESEWKYASIVMDRLNGLKKEVTYNFKGSLRLLSHLVWSLRFSLRYFPRHSDQLLINKSNKDD
jgi:hypothetical protein